MDFSSVNNFWDLSQTPSQFSQLGDEDFLALLQKQYPNTVPDLNSTDLTGVNPQSIQKLPLPGLSPPSDESSPSPPSGNSNDGSRSRRHSTFSRGNDNDEPVLKRKATDDAMQEGPSSKNQHTGVSLAISLHHSSHLSLCFCVQLMTRALQKKGQFLDESRPDPRRSVVLSTSIIHTELTRHFVIRMIHGY
jgi:hypothetical protein